MDKHPVNVLLNKDQYKKLKNIAEQKDVTVQVLMRKITEYYIGTYGTNEQIKLEL